MVILADEFMSSKYAYSETDLAPTKCSAFDFGMNLKSFKKNIKF